MTGPDRTTTITLRAPHGAPLADAKIRDLVVATAHSIAERSGVTPISITAERDRVTAVLPLDRIAALGFAAELRRLTDRWHRAKFGGAPLWGEPPPHEGEGEP